MSRPQSLADHAVHALSAVVEMDRGIDTRNPERHALRILKETAEQILADAFKRVDELAFKAAALRMLGDDTARVDPDTTPNAGIHRAAEGRPVE